MAEIWNAVTLPQAILAVALLWILVRGAEQIAWWIARRGGAVVGDCCEHCGDVEDLTRRFDRFAERTVANFNTLNDHVRDQDATQDRVEVPL